MRKRRKNTFGLVILSLFMVCIATVGFTYGLTKVLGLPIDLPFMPQQVLATSSIADVEPIIDSWKDVIVYESKVEEIEEIIVEPEPIPEPAPLSTKFDNIIELATLQSYLDSHVDVAANGYEMIFIDEVTKNNKSVGIKTKAGDDVLALANYDGVMIAGLTTESGSNIKIAFVSKDTDTKLSVVEISSYWDEISVSAPKNKALFAVNASDYTWNYTYDCGSLKGIVKRNGDTIRKANNQELVVGISSENDLIIGEPDSISTGVEGTQALIKNGVTLYNLEAEITDETKEAKTAIGELSDGTKMFVIADNTNGGVTVADVVKIFNKYNAVDAMMLGCGTRTVMWWNGRIAINMSESDTDGVKLPTTWYVESVYTEAANNIASSVSESQLLITDSTLTN